MKIAVSILLGAVGGFLATINGYSLSDAGFWGWLLPFALLSALLNVLMGE